MLEHRCYLHRAPYVVPVSADSNMPAVIKDGAVLTENGRIKAVGTYNELKSSDAVLAEHAQSLLMPPLVNCHTHLELSHLADLGQNTPAPGDITGWIKNLLTTREKGEDPEESLMAAQLALARLYAGGCRGVLDIGNLAASRSIADNFKVEVMFFREFLGLTEKSIAESLSLLSTIEDENNDALCTAHAPYSTSPKLIRALKKRSLEHEHLFSIHVAESEDEIQFLNSGDGRLRDFLVERNALDDSFQIPGLSPVAYLDDLGVLDKQTLCVHCVHCTEDDLQIMKKRRVTACICPGSNRFLGVGVAPVRQMLDHGIPLLGTDSLASNPQLSLWEEMRILAEDHPDIDSIDIIKIATRNGAEFMGIENEYGSLDPGHSASFLAVSRESPFPANENTVLNRVVSGGLSIVSEWVE